MMAIFGSNRQNMFLGFSGSKKALDFCWHSNVPTLAVAYIH